MASSGSWKRSVTARPQVPILDNVPDVGRDTFFQGGVINALVLEFHRLGNALQILDGDTARPRLNGSFKGGLGDKGIHECAVEGLGGAP